MRKGREKTMHVRHFALCWLVLAGAGVSTTLPLPVQAAWLKTSDGCTVFMNRLPEKWEASWSGVCREGRASGKGTFTMTTQREDGPRTSKITGRMQAGRLTGQVRIEPGNGNVLEGKLIDGKLRAGAIAFADGHRYEGPIENGLPNGRGVIRYPDGRGYSGDLKNGVRQGQGAATYKDGARYNGGWRYDLRHGTGTFTTAKGMTISGTFENDRLRGKARFTRADGTWFEGPTRKQAPHGKGTCGSSQSEVTTACQFRKGRFVR